MISFNFHNNKFKKVSDDKQAIPTTNKSIINENEQ